VTCHLLLCLSSWVELTGCQRVQSRNIELALVGVAIWAPRGVEMLRRVEQSHREHCLCRLLSGALSAEPLLMHSGPDLGMRIAAELSKCSMQNPHLHARMQRKGLLRCGSWQSLQRQGRFWRHSAPMCLCCVRLLHLLEREWLVQLADVLWQKLLHEL